MTPEKGATPYERLKAAIVSGELLPGEQLTETELAEQLHVSRTPIREAFHKLLADGLVERGPRGLQVVERSPEDILQIYELRAALEAIAARTAAVNATVVDHMRLQRILAASRSLSEDDVADQLVKANREFHSTVWVISRNNPLRDLLERLDLHLLRYPATTLKYPGRWERGVNQHEAIAAAIQEGDGDKAARLAESHFQEARDIRMKLWAEGEV